MKKLSLNTSIIEEMYVMAIAVAHPIFFMPISNHYNVASIINPTCALKK
jgi:hypothetical protein